MATIDLTTCPYCKTNFSRAAVCTKHMFKCKHKNIHKPATHDADRELVATTDEGSSQVHDIPTPGTEIEGSKQISVCICNKAYLYKRNLDRHQLTCKIFMEQGKAINNNVNNGISQTGDSSLAFQNCFNGNTINVSPTIKINPVGKESFAHITPADINRVLMSGNCAFKELINLVYQDPANHNLCFANKKEGRLKYLKNMLQTEIDNMVKILNRLVGNYEDKLDEYIDNFCEDKASASSYIGILLQQLSDDHADGIHDRKNLDSMINTVMLIGNSAKKQLTALEQEVSKLRQTQQNIKS